MALNATLAFLISTASGNTILITGGGSGIGRALAEAFHAAGNEVVIAGRRQQVLDDTTTANPGMKSVVLDIENNDAIQNCAAQLKTDYPTLNVVIHNAGIMRAESIQAGKLDDAEATSRSNIASNGRSVAIANEELSLLKMHA